MTNYNERLDEILFELANYAHGIGAAAAGYGIFVGGEPQEKAKQAITSLIKELVAEVKPEKHIHHHAYGKPFEDAQDIAYNAAIDQFKKNLLKALESKNE